MNLLNRLKEIQELPTLPEVVREVIRLVHLETTDANVLADIIEEDPSLASKILKVANSTFYGTPNTRISSLALAIARLGFHEVRELAVAMGCVRHFASMKHSLGYKDFWRHSLAAAYLARIVRERSSFRLEAMESTTLFLAGLFHDIGLLVLDQFFHDYFDEVVQYSVAHETSYLVAEEAVLGSETHAAIGGALLELWRLDPAVIAGVRYHHSPVKSPERFRVVSAAVTLAEHVLCNGKLGSFEGTSSAIDPQTWAILNLSPDTEADLFASAEKEVARSDLILALESKPKGGRG